MFCKNCGKAISEGDSFCGNCGTRIVSDGKSKKINVNLSLPKFSFKDIAIKDLKIVEMMKMYFKKPLSFFKEINESELVNTCVTFLIGLPIIYGLLNILYNASFLSSLFSEMKKLPELLVEMGVIQSSEATAFKNEILLSSSLSNFKGQINSMVDNKELFINGFLNVLMLMLVTGIILYALNSLILKKKLNEKQIFLISTASYIPLVLSLAAATIVTFISMTFGIFIILAGYILSFITLYNGIQELSEESCDNAFRIMIVIFVCMSIILSIAIIGEFHDSLKTIGKTVQAFKGFI